jgi:Secretion system C-terminal sorting domain
MKKILCFLTIFTFSFNYAQILIDENCSTFTLGNLSTDLTGASPGQGGWKIASAAGTPLSSFQVFNGGLTNGNVIELTGSQTSSGNRFIFNDAIGSRWTTRTSGNEIIEVELDFYTSSNNSSNAEIDIAIFDTTGSKILCGFAYDPQTGSFKGLSYFGNATNPANNYFINPPNAIFLQTSTWYKIGCSFNKTTGLVRYKGTVGGIPFDFQFNGSAAASNVGEFDIINIPLATNTFSSVIQFDNVKIKASSSDTLLAINASEAFSGNFNLYPNPTNDFIKISNNENIKITSIILTDLNGRIVKSDKINNLSDFEINLTELSKGIYLMNIFSEKGSFNKKIIKE